MPSDYWDESFSDAEIDAEEIDAFHVVRGDDGWDIYADIGGEMVSLADDLDDDEMESLFWDDLYDWAMDNDIDVDRAIEYAQD
jgi:hypothetical protein